MADEKKLDDLQNQEENNPAPQQPEAADTQEQQDELTRLKEAHATLNDKYLRMLAEYDNYRKRTARERESLYPEAEAGLLTRLLPFVDDLERAMGSPCSDPEYKKGMEMIVGSLKEFFSSLGVEELGAPGEGFDPNLHHAVMHVEDEALGENVVVEVLQKGYRRGERLLRCAMVKTAN